MYRLALRAVGEEEKDREASSPGKKGTSYGRIGTLKFALPRLNFGPNSLGVSQPESRGLRQRVWLGPCDLASWPKKNM